MKTAIHVCARQSRSPSQRSSTSPVCTLVFLAITGTSNSAPTPQPRQPKEISCKQQEPEATAKRRSTDRGDRSSLPRLLAPNPSLSAPAGTSIDWDPFGLRDSEGWTPEFESLQRVVPLALLRRRPPRPEPASSFFDSRRPLSAPDALASPLLDSLRTLLPAAEPASLASLDVLRDLVDWYRSRRELLRPAQSNPESLSPCPFAVAIVSLLVEVPSPLSTRSSPCTTRSSTGFYRLIYPRFLSSRSSPQFIVAVYCPPKCIGNCFATRFQTPIHREVHDRPAGSVVGRLTLTRRNTMLGVG